MRNDKRILWVVMWIVVAATIAVAGIGAWRIGPRWLLADLPTPTTEALAPIQPSTLILDRQGQVLYEVIPETGKQTPLSIDEIPAACWQATVAVEDSRFFEHPGFDPLAILRAAWQNWRNGAIVSGASTLTQQLARNALMSPEERYETSLRRKLREAWLAWHIERRYSKEDILALYHNQIYYGNFSYGLEAAAQAYYGKSARELDLAECSLLAGLPQSPATYNPLLNELKARQRQATVLDLMVAHGYITRKEAELALAEQLQFASTPFPVEAPHFVSFVEMQLEGLLAARGSTASRHPLPSTEQWALSGLRVFTTLDLDWQHQSEATVRWRLTQLAEDPEAPMDRRIENAAVVILDPKTGAIRTMVGSPDYFDASIAGAVNGAIARRQPGSAIKPLTYAVAMDPAWAARNGRSPLTVATVLADVRTVFSTAEGEPYVPENYDRSWHGPVSVRTALASSYNVPAVKVLDTIGVDALIAQAQRQGITTFRPGGPRSIAFQEQETTVKQAATPYGLALTLGGGEVTLLQLTGAYGAFANGGYRIEPYAIERIEDIHGNLLFQAAAAPRTPALDGRVAYLITDILSDNDARAPAFGPNSVLRIGRPAAVKTGTTTDWRDNWTVGYTPDLVVGVWVGNADNSPMLGVSGVTGAGPIWRDIIEMAHHNLPPRPFSRPEGLLRSEICIDSGLLPTQWCLRRRSELFIDGTEPTEFDGVYQPTLVNACATSPISGAALAPCLQERITRVYPAELGEWAAERALEQSSRVLAEGSSAGGTASPMLASSAVQDVDTATSHWSCGVTLTSPDPNQTLRLSTALPAELQQVRLAVWAAGDCVPDRVSFMVDGEPVGEALGPPFETWWPLRRGVHAITARVHFQSPTNIGGFSSQDRFAAPAKMITDTIWIDVR